MPMGWEGDSELLRVRYVYRVGRFISWPGGTKKNFKQITRKKQGGRSRDRRYDRLPTVIENGRMDLRTGIATGDMVFQSRALAAISINQLPVVHHVPDSTCVANVGQRIRVEEDEVGPLPYFDRAELFVSAEDSGRGASARLNRL